MNKFIKILKFLYLIFFIFSIIACGGDSQFLKNPTRFQFSKYENRGEKSILLARANNECDPILSKRIYNYLFFVPFNGLTKEETSRMSQANSIRFRNVFNLTDFLITSAGFLFSITAYSLEVDKCEDGEFVKTPSKKQNRDEEVVDIPILKKYSKFVELIDNPTAQEYFVLFQSNSASFLPEEDKKIERFAKLYLKDYKQYKILLMGHAAEGDLKTTILLSFDRVRSIKQQLIKYGINEKLIFTTGSGAYWPKSSNENANQKFSRRVDLVLMD